MSKHRKNCFSYFDNYIKISFIIMLVLFLLKPIENVMFLIHTIALNYFYYRKSIEVRDSITINDASDNNENNITSSINLSIMSNLKCASILLLIIDVIYSIIICKWPIPVDLLVLKLVLIPNLALLLSAYLAIRKLNLFEIMTYVLSSKKFYRLNTWNNIMYKDEYEQNKSRVIIDKEILDKNRKLIEFEEYKEFKSRLKKISDWDLEEIIFYDRLPFFKTNILTWFFTTILTTILTPIQIPSLLRWLIEFWYDSFGNDLIINLIIIIILLLLILLISVCLYFYKSYTFPEKRKQIDSFFYKDILEELKNRNNN